MGPLKRPVQRQCCLIATGTWQRRRTCPSLHRTSGGFEWRLGRWLIGGLVIELMLWLDYLLHRHYSQYPAANYHY
uniref:Uncharacterized protein n=1 Tax=uncultured marine virus TaxID=186617 RepID=A0A0F7L4Z3_9VIRU|nr:hypothetical protein [uncultured marine virus]